MYDIIPFILILISLGTIMYIVVRKFSALASLDVDNIPFEKETKFKERIISDRLKRNIKERSEWMISRLRLVSEKINGIFKYVYDKLHELKMHHEEDKILSEEQTTKKTKELLSEADDLMDVDEFEEAEKKLIESLTVNNKDINAFKKLSDLYFEQKKYEEARETLEHILKIDGEEGEVYFDLSLVYKAMDDQKKSMENIKKALQIIPNNPRYLDTMIEIGIINKDRVAAQDAYNKLSQVNPENQKLDELKSQIDEL